MINQSRLIQTFLDLVAIDSPSGHEAAISQDLARRLAALGGAVESDEHGNLIARWPGQGGWLMLSAHMDTAGADTGIKPQIRDGVIYSDGTTILGGDDKSGVAAILEVIQSLQEDGAPHPPLEVVISVSEEVGLAGAKLLDKSKLLACRGYVLDSGGPIGTVVISAPSQDSLRITVFGKKAHAGSEPEKGVNAIRVAAEAIAAMPLGRIDAETTANIGVIEGGTATNIVPDEVHIRGEARSRDNDKLAAQVVAMAAAFQDAAERNGGRVEFKITRSYNTYRLTEDTPVVAHAIAAARRLGFAPVLKASGGGADANIYAEHDITCAVISTGMVEVHTPHEHIAIADMVDATRLLAEIVMTS
ncbi:MAG: M20/M25/M40 family metallo-hydrolase [Chloroflexi bacterium]|nr:M20/M25/M40 family metallo-hydrolase [Chloroflexota bacterium]